MKYAVAVRTLCEFTAKAGDLDLRFTPSPTAPQGLAGHRVVASRRGASYQSEIALSGTFGCLEVRGRADGYDPDANRLEEVKTYRGDLAAMRANHRALHWAQARVYGSLLCRRLGLRELEVALVYFDIATAEETVLRETFTAQSLHADFEARCAQFIAWAEHELAHRRARDAALAELRFPHGAFRAGQRELAHAVYRSAAAGGCLLAQAPTGVGKTLGTLFPLLKAAPARSLDKVFFLAAKTSGRQLALDALALLCAGTGEPAPPAGAGERRRGVPLRIVELVARDKACEHPDKACHGESCPLARGFYDRLPAARADALLCASAGEASTLDRAAIRATALRHAVCPYYLSQELVRWADVVVGDYNYYFDTSAMLHAMTVAESWRAALLVDEAHNLVERARAMYTAGLARTGLHAAYQAAPPALRPVLQRLDREWVLVEDEGSAAYQVVEAPPVRFLQALQQAAAAITEELADRPNGFEAPLQRFYFDALHFQRMAEQLGEHSMADVTRAAEGGCTLTVRNLVPAHFLRPRFAAAVSAALFSATLNPRAYYSDMLGLPEGTAWLDAQSPFAAEQLRVRVAGRISTRYRHRERSLEPIVALMARQYAQQPGNYLAFVSSFDYLDQVAALLRSRHPEIPTWEQTRGMDEGQRAGFVARFTPASRGIAFAVLGGAFGEGVDLPGDRLIGAFIATLGLPQVNPVNAQMERRMQESFGAGFDYTYLYPGIRKVVQAAGRVIRSRGDRGVVYLIDDRFNRPDVLRLLPGWWQVERGAAQA